MDFSSSLGRRQLTKMCKFLYFFFNMQAMFIKPSACFNGLLWTMDKIISATVNNDVFY